MTWSGWEQSTSSVAEPSAISVKVTVPPGSTWAWSAVAATGAAEGDGSAREGAGRAGGGARPATGGRGRHRPRPAAGGEEKGERGEAGPDHLREFCPRTVRLRQPSGPRARERTEA